MLESIDKNSKNILDELKAIKNNQNNLESKFDNNKNSPTNITLNVSDEQEKVINSFIDDLRNPEKMKDYLSGAIDNVLSSLNVQLGDIKDIVIDTKIQVNDISEKVQNISGNVYKTQTDVSEIKGWFARNLSLTYLTSIISFLIIIIILIFLNQRKEEVNITLPSQITKIDTIKPEISDNDNKKLNNKIRSKIESNSENKNNSALLKGIDPQCDLNGIQFRDDRSMENEITFHKKNIGLYDITGYLEIEGVVATAVTNGNNISIKSGNIEGILILMDGCKQLKGNLKLKSNNAFIKINYNSN